MINQGRPGPLINDGGLNRSTHHLAVRPSTALTMTLAGSTPPVRRRWLDDGAGDGETQRAAARLPAARGEPTGPVSIILAPHRVRLLPPASVPAIVNPGASNLEAQACECYHCAQRLALEWAPPGQGGDPERGPGNSDPEAAQQHAGGERVPVRWTHIDVCTAHASTAATTSRFRSWDEPHAPAADVARAG